MPILMVLALLCSCAVAPKKVPENKIGQSDAAQSSPSTHTWRIGRYQVRFAAGPHKYLPGGGQKSYSTFAVTYRKEGEVPVSEVAASGNDIELFAYTPDLKIHEFIKVFVSPSQKYLLIAEDVLNDGATCSNYILFQLAGDELRASYLKMATWLSSEQPLASGAILPVRHFPTIRSLTDEEVEFTYLNQKSNKLRLQDIPPANGVIFP